METREEQSVNSRSRKPQGVEQPLSYRAFLKSQNNFFLHFNGQPEDEENFFGELYRERTPFRKALPLEAFQAIARSLYNVDFHSPVNKRESVRLRKLLYRAYLIMKQHASTNAELFK